MTRLRFFIIIVSLSFLVWSNIFQVRTRIDFDDKLSSSPLYDVPVSQTLQELHGNREKAEVNKTSSNRDDTTLNNTRASSTNKVYRILQSGGSRTGSTFQYQLLCSIVQMKNPPDAPPAICSFIGKNLSSYQDAIKSGASFVFKTHYSSEAMINATRDNDLEIFSSGGRGSKVAVYIQQREQLEKCPICEIKEYKPFFGLSDEEVKQLENHMQLFTIIRQCCGLQMSKYEVLRLNGCDVSSYVDKPDYPHCERHDLDKTEQEFAASRIPYIVNNPKFNWAKPGDCKRFREKTEKKKLGFNGKAVTSCKLEKIIGVKKKNNEVRKKHS